MTFHCPGTQLLRPDDSEYEAAMGQEYARPGQALFATLDFDTNMGYGKRKKMTSNSTCNVNVAKRIHWPASNPLELLEYNCDPGSHSTFLAVLALAKKHVPW
jgi:hypothetical protein